ncbi:fanconi anemia group m protein [Anaeramoeba flamelloides]|uniref:Fanconi anemia group m protein n=1 Tax=Anaeramoeba flamelloides TaxID=1746091 RepID=A0ABQ8YYP4_9EUKA|nr:fanconi anemia group m protein [Anaeramoeba flamelloides]
MTTIKLKEKTKLQTLQRMQPKDFKEEEAKTNYERFSQTSALLQDTNRKSFSFSVSPFFLKENQTASRSPKKCKLNFQTKTASVDTPKKIRPKRKARRLIRFEDFDQTKKKKTKTIKTRSIQKQNKENHDQPTKQINVKKILLSSNKTTNISVMTIKNFSLNRSNGFFPQIPNSKLVNKRNITPTKSFKPQSVFNKTPRTVPKRKKLKFTKNQPTRSVSPKLLKTKKRLKQLSHPKVPKLNFQNFKTSTSTSTSTCTKTNTKTNTITNTKTITNTNLQSNTIPKTNLKTDLITKKNTTIINSSSYTKSIRHNTNYNLNNHKHFQPRGNKTANSTQQVSNSIPSPFAKINYRNQLQKQINKQTPRKQPQTPQRLQQKPQIPQKQQQKQQQQQPTNKKISRKQPQLHPQPRQQQNNFRKTVLNKNGISKQTTLDSFVIQKNTLTNLNYSCNRNNKIKHNYYNSILNNKSDRDNLPKQDFVPSTKVFNNIFDDDDNETDLHNHSTNQKESQALQKEYLLENVFPMERSKYKTEEYPKFDADAVKKWIYPTNYPLRDYQFNITSHALYENTLVVLPTGLGKTLIAAVVMYNYYRWFPTGKILFLAPTKPLIHQQIGAVRKFVGFKSDCCEITGEISSTKREPLWERNRVFFGTPQTVANDLETGICPAKDIVCVVFDEVHHATGNYDYTNIIKKLLRVTNQFRVLALSATPGTTKEQIQHVIANCLISRLEARFNEGALNSIDLFRYLFRKTISVIKVNNESNSGIKKVKEIIKPFLEQILKPLYSGGVYWTDDVDKTSRGSLLKCKKRFSLTKKKLNGEPLKGYQIGIFFRNFGTALSLFYGYKLLTDFGLVPFYQFLLKHYPKNSNTKMKITKRKFFDSNTFITLSAILPDLIKEENSHPKIIKLKEILEDHFQRNQDTRVMIFSSYRSSVIDITRALQDIPSLKVMPFVGQATTDICRGYTQKEQQLIIKRFKKGTYNTLVATCIGEEGLDIGEIDLIICYDANLDPKRTVQRFGRTGRKRQGKVVVLISEGVEERNYTRAKEKKKYIDHTLTDSKNFVFYPKNKRMIPKNISPKCLKKNINSKKIKVVDDGTEIPLPFKEIKEDLDSYNTDLITQEIEPIFEENLDGILYAKNRKRKKSYFLKNKRKKKPNKKGKYLSTGKQYYFDTHYRLSNSEQIPELSINRYIEKQQYVSPIFNFGHSTATLFLQKNIRDLNKNYDNSDLIQPENMIEKEIEGEEEEEEEGEEDQEKEKEKEREQEMEIEN